MCSASKWGQVCVIHANKASSENVKLVVKDIFGEAPSLLLISPVNSQRSLTNRLENTHFSLLTVGYKMVTISAVSLTLHKKFAD